ncbi:MAG: phage head morphogenesis protein [Bacteroides sp.]|nr:phage head morphogenesis protein [Bacteroides sp.]
MALEKEDNGIPEGNVDTAEVEAGFLLLMTWLYSRPDFNPGMMKEPEVQEFVDKTAEVLNKAIDVSLKEVPMPDISVQRLKESNYVFSGIKTFHELNEAFLSLTDESGNIKPFEQFLNDVQKVNESYNRHYLKAVYNFAQSSARMAAKWQRFWNDEDRERYLLQYRTMGDKRVRDSHRLMHNITLPITSKFWDWYFPPNGWNCRCNVVQVRRGKYAESNKHEAMNLGSQATAGKHQEMFRFNPGKRMTTFPAYNAYTISKCQNCKENGTLKLAAKIPDNELCAACRVVREMRKNETRLLEIKQAKKDLVDWYKKNLPSVKVGKFEARRFEVEREDHVVVINKGFYNEVIAHYKNDPNYAERLKLSEQAHEWMKEATFKRVELSEHHPDAKFDVYEYIHEGVAYELKCKQNRDGYYLYYMKRK